MKSVGTAVLKNNLSKYLKRVRKGDRFIITDHDVPVAKLTPLSQETEESLDEKLVRLAAAGQISYNPHHKKIRKHKKIDLKSQLVSQMLIQDRED